MGRAGRPYLLPVFESNHGGAPFPKIVPPFRRSPAFGDITYSYYVKFS
jgi:hypothetical protein